jgi:hypothetical protein
MRISRYLGALTKGRSSAESAGRAVRVLPSPLSIRSSGDRLIHITQVRSVRRLHLMHPFLEISLSNSLVRRAFHDSWLAVLRQIPLCHPTIIFPPSKSAAVLTLQPNTFAYRLMHTTTRPCITESLTPEIGFDCVRESWNTLLDTTTPFPSYDLPALQFESYQQSSRTLSLTQHQCQRSSHNSRTQIG